MVYEHVHWCELLKVKLFHTLVSFTHTHTQNQTKTETTHPRMHAPHAMTTGHSSCGNCCLCGCHVELSAKHGHGYTHVQSSLEDKGFGTLNRSQMLITVLITV